jgi:hypothetical protein
MKLFKRRGCRRYGRPGRGNEMGAIIYAIGLFVAFHIAMWALAHVVHWWKMWRHPWYREYDHDLREAALEEKRRQQRSTY